MRLLGRTGVQVSDLCLGCMMFGGRTEPEESYRIIDRALDAGINFLDTANVYSRGRSEEVVGEALKRNGKRDRIILATKVHGEMADGDPNMQGNSRRHIIQQCDASLKRLKTDYIDVYQIHRPQSDIPIDETLRVLDDLVHAGKVRYVGTSTYAAWQVIESLWVSERLGLNRFVTEQPPYNLLDRRIERELLPACRTYGIAVLPWSPIAGGILSGKYTRQNPKPAEGRYSNVDDNPRMKNRVNNSIWDIVEGLTEMARKKGVTLSQFALAWVRDQSGVTSAIIGPRTMEQLEDNLKVSGITFTQAELAAIDALSAPGSSVSPFYEADFGPHLFR